MPSILLTADLHLSDNPRDSYRLKFLDSLPDLCKRRDVDAVAILGDLTEEKDRHRAWLVNRIVDGLHRLASDVHVIVIRGNHDYIDVESPFFEFLGRIEGLSYVSSPSLAETLSSPILAAGNAVHLLPHCARPEKEWASLSFGNDDWIFCHQTFEGATAGFGKKLAGIPPSVFPATARVFAGDIHVPQDVQQITYVGAPYTIDFGDAYQPRVILIEGTEVKSLRLGGPGKRLIEVNEFEELDSALDDVVDGDMIKVRINLPHADYQDWPKIKRRVLQWGEHYKLQIHTVQPVVDFASVNQRRRKEQVQQTDTELLEEYAKHRGIDDRTLKTGKIIMEET